MAKMSKEDKEACSLLTPVFRVSHPHVFKATKMKDAKSGKEIGEARYSIEMLFDKSKVKASTFMKPLKHAAALKYGEDQSQWPEGLKYAIRNGDKPHGKKKEIKPEHKGMWIVKASSKEDYGRPHVLGRNKKPIEQESELYPGCFACAHIFASTYEVGEKEGVSFILDGVMKTDEGPSLGGKKSADEMFGAIEASEDDDLDSKEQSFDDIEDDEAGF